MRCCAHSSICLVTAIGYGQEGDLPEASWWVDEAIHDEYSLVLSGAHRRRVTPMGAPALTRHLAFWNPVVPTLPSEASLPESYIRGRNEPERLLKRALVADHCVSEIYRGLLELQRGEGNDLVRGLTADETVSDYVPLFATVIDRTTGRVCEGSNIVTDTYRSVKLEFFWRDLLTKMSWELHAEYLVLTTIIDLSGLSSNDHSRYPASNTLVETVTNICTADHVTEQYEVDRWRREIYEDVWSDFNEEVLTCLREKIGLLGLVFADFRGLVVRPSTTSARFSLPLVESIRSRFSAEREVDYCDISELNHAVPFISRSHEIDTEFTVSYFLDRRAIYSTALGRQTGHLARPIPMPLQYFLYEKTLNPWQLGRLVYRIHRAGTARLAAIMHFNGLRQANSILGEIEVKMEEAIAIPPGKDPAKRRQTLMDLSDEISRKLALVAKLGLEPSLESRVERSRYYVSQFRTTVESLRIQRIEGYQPYDQFVSQRMAPMFDYIDRLGRKFSRVQQDRLLLASRIQALGSLYETKLIANAQRLADIGLSCVLGPYYVAYILSHGTIGLLPARAVWLGALFFMFLMYAAIRRREKMRLRQPGRLATRKAKGPIKAWITAQWKRRLTLFAALGAFALLLGYGADRTLGAIGFLASRG